MTCACVAFAWGVACGVSACAFWFWLRRAFIDDTGELCSHE